MTNRDCETSLLTRGVPPQTIVIPPQSSQAAWWLIGISLAVLAISSVLRTGDGRAVNRVFAQPAGSAGAHGVFAFTGQLSSDSYGVFMVDVDAGTIWCYRYVSNRNLLKLVAARDWKYDRYLKNFSTEPSPEFIKEELEQQRAAALHVAEP